nr:hypothetical protein [Tanacetum cinerariifolium]
MIVAPQAGEGVAEGNVDDVPAAGVAIEGAASVNVDDVLAAVDEPSILSPTPPTQTSPPSQDIPSTSQVKHTPPPSPIAQPPSPQQQPQPSQDARVKKLERRNKLKVYKLRRLKKVGTAQRVDTSDDTVMDDVSKQGRIIADMDKDVNATLKDIGKDVDVDAEIEENADVQGRQAESQAQIYKIDLEHADKVLSMQDDYIELAELHEVVEVVTTAKLITEVVTAASATITVAAPQLTIVAALTLTTAPSTARRRKGVVIRDLEETATPSTIIHTESKSKDKGKGILTKEQMEEKDSRALKMISESQEDKAAKKQKLDEEVTELKRHLQIVPNDEDDVYTVATPLARKVPVIDYEIYTENNKPYYKIIRADRSPQLFLSFLSLLRNFDREDLEVL